jgi:hypothetical protein
VASVLRAHGPAVRDSLPHPQRRLLDAVTRCRTEEMGGHVGLCSACGAQEFRYHSCRDRHCPTCSAGRTRAWLTTRQPRLLPVPHFQVVFTLPALLRPLARAAPRVVYNALMDAAACTLQDVLKTQYDARFAVTAVLHTWTRELQLHPHVHFMVSAGGLSYDDLSWVPTGNFLVSTRKLAPVFRARVLERVRAALAEDPLAEPLRSRVGGLLQRAARKTWVIHIDPPDGRSPEGILRYLARYLFRVAIDDRRVLRHEGELVTIRTRGNETSSMSGEDFVRRFVQHALPKGFRKVRQYGLLAPGNVRVRLAKAMELVEELGATRPEVVPEREPAADPRWDPLSDEVPPEVCRSCGARAVRWWVLAPVRGPPGRSVRGAS